jgi:phospholipid/cholesterol/gamma-HCH transport system substrate-binding protein
MKKHSTEIKVGVIMTITLAVFVWLFNYVKGLNILNPIHHYYVVYDDINGLKESNTVFINGYKVGLVDDIKFLNHDAGKLVVTISLEQNVTIPKDSRAVLINADIMGTKALRIDRGSSPENLEYGDTLPGEIEAGLMDQLNEEIVPLKEKTEHLVVTLDSLATVVNDMLDDDFRSDFAKTTRDLQVTMAHLRRMSYTLDTMMTHKDGHVQKILAGVRENLDKLDHVMDNLAQLSDSLTDAEIKETISNLNNTLRGTALLMQRINNGEGSLGKLTTNDSLYLAIQHLTMRLDTLVDKIANNPKKYIRIKLF